MSRSISMNMPERLSTPVFGGLSILAIAAALSGCSPTLPACDSTLAQDTFKNAVQRAAPITISTFTNIQTTSRTATTAACTAHATLGDGRQVDYGYSLTLAGSRMNLLVTTATITSGGTSNASAAVAPASAAPAPVADRAAETAESAPAENGDDVEGPSADANDANTPSGGGK